MDGENTFHVGMDVQAQNTSDANQKLPLDWQQENNGDLVESSYLHDGSDRGKTGNSRSGSLDLNFWRLPDLLFQTRNFGCQDPRDRLYALLPLFHRPIPSLLYPDYSKPLEEVFQNMSRFFVDDGLANALSYSNGAKFGMPSWASVPHETHMRPPLRTHIQFGVRRDRNRPWRCGFSGGLREVHTPRYTKSGRGLTYRGYVIQRVQPYVYYELWATGPPALGLPKLLCTLQESKREGSRLYLELYILVYRPELGHWAPPGSVCSHFKDVGTSVATALASWGSCSDLWSVNPACNPRLHAFSKSTKFDLDIDQSHQHEFVGMLETLLRETHTITDLTHHNFKVSGHGLSDLEALQGYSSYTISDQDSLCILVGLESPVIMTQKDGDWLLKGECYADEEIIMSGKLLDSLDIPDIHAEPCPTPLQDFLIR